MNYIITEEELSIYLRLSAVKKHETDLTFKEMAIDFLKSKQPVELFTELEELQQKAINTLNDSGLKLMEENKELESKLAKEKSESARQKSLAEAHHRLRKRYEEKLANQKYLDRQEVEKIIWNMVDKQNTVEWIIKDTITAICNLAYDKNKITAILVGKILESDKDAVKIADEIISAIGGK